MLKRKKAIEELAATLEEEHAEKVKEKTSGNTTPDKKEEFKQKYRDYQENILKSW